MDKIIKGSDESIQEFVQRIVEHPTVRRHLQPLLELPWFPPILLGWYPKHTIAYSAWRQGPSDEDVCAFKDAMREFTDIGHHDFDLEDATTCVAHDWSYVPCRKTYRREGEIVRRLVVRANGVRGVVVFRREPMILEKFPEPMPSF